MQQRVGLLKEAADELSSEEVATLYDKPRRSHEPIPSRERTRSPSRREEADARRAEGRQFPAADGWYGYQESGARRETRTDKRPEEPECTRI